MDTKYSWESGSGKPECLIEPKSIPSNDLLNNSLEILSNLSGKLYMFLAILGPFWGFLDMIGRHILGWKAFKLHPMLAIGQDLPFPLAQTGSSYTWPTWKVDKYFETIRHWFTVLKVNLRSIYFNRRSIYFLLIGKLGWIFRYASRDAPISKFMVLSPTTNEQDVSTSFIWGKYITIGEVKML